MTCCHHDQMHVAPWGIMSRMSFLPAGTLAYTRASILLPVAVMYLRTWSGSSSRCGWHYGKRLEMFHQPTKTFDRSLPHTMRSLALCIKPDAAKCTHVPSNGQYLRRPKVYPSDTFCFWTLCSPPHSPALRHHLVHLVVGPRHHPGSFCDSPASQGLLSAHSTHKILNGAWSVEMQARVALPDTFFYRYLQHTTYTHRNW